MQYRKTASVMGALAFTSLVSAAPMDARDISFGNRAPHAKAYADAQAYSAPASSPSAWAAPAYTGPATSTGASAAFTGYPLANGFPNVAAGSKALTDINVQAHGSLSNAPPPATLNNAADDIISFEAIALEELMEVAFFTELLFNVTSNVPGYQFQDHVFRQEVIDNLEIIIAQEELHVLNAENALNKFNGGKTIAPCTYNFPVEDFETAIFVATLFTDVVLGTLPDIQTHFATANDPGFIRGVGSVLAQEGGQMGWFRSILGKNPSANPFLTAATREIAANALAQNFIVSCPASDSVPLATFGKLAVSTQQPGPKDQTLTFSFSAAGKYKQGDSVSLVYINQQNLPIVEPLQNIKVNGDIVTFEGQFPFTANLMFGLSIALVVPGDAASLGKLAIADLVPKALYGPALIEV